MKTKPPTEAIEVAQIKRTSKRIEIKWSQGENKRSLAERDNPLPAFLQSFDALASLVPTICHLPAEYAETNLRVVGVKIGSQGGSATASLVVRKGLDDASKEFVFTTPARLLSDPTEEGSYSPPLTAGDAELIEEVIEQAKRYVRGERAQGQIAFEDEAEDADETENNDPLAPAELPLAAPEMAHNKGKRGRKKNKGGEVIELPDAKAAK